MAAFGQFSAFRYNRIKFIDRYNNLPFSPCFSLLFAEFIKVYKITV